jgi:multiple sugar transport system substrate-binding protein
MGESAFRFPGIAVKVRKFVFMNGNLSSVGNPDPIDQTFYRSSSNWLEPKLRGIACWLISAILLLLTGCPKPATPISRGGDDLEKTSVPDTLTVLLIDDDLIGTAIARHWSAESGGTLELSNLTSLELRETDFAIPQDVDVVIYPCGLIGELESRKLLVPFSRKIWQSEEYKKDELLRIYRNFTPKHRNETWGVPLGGPVFTLVFSQSVASDLVASDIDPGASLDWDRLRELVDKRRAQPDSNFQFKMPLANGWAVQVFLARSASLIRSRGRLSTVFERGTMQPLINSKPFVLALNDIKTLMGRDNTQLELNPAELFREIARGQTSLGLTWPTPPSIDAEGGLDGPQTELYFASLPGSDQWYEHKSDRWIQRSPMEATHYDLIGFAGMLGSVTTYSRNTDDAFEFLAWLGNKSTPLKTLIYSPNSGPFRASHLGNLSLWCDDSISDDSARRYAEVIDAMNQRDIVFMFPRIPHRQEYLNVMDDNVRGFLSGAGTAEDCLEQTAKQWNEITDRLGREKMIAELSKESGL